MSSDPDPLFLDCDSTDGDADLSSISSQEVHVTTMHILPTYVHIL